jgi:rubrerythrin
LSGGAKVTLGGALAVTGLSSPALSRLQASAQEFSDDVDVLNYALTLEHLEYAFYRDGIGQFTFGADPFGNSIDEYLAQIRDHEGAHVETLTQVITDLGGEPVAEGEYDFGYTDAASFLTTAAALENTGVRAYDGAGAAITDPDLLTAAGTIVAVEARHASYLNLLIGELPFPEPTEDPATPEEVLEIASPFIVGSDAATPSA